MYKNPMDYQLKYSNKIWKHTSHLILSWYKGIIWPIIEKKTNQKMSFASFWENAHNIYQGFMWHKLHLVTMQGYSNYKLLVKTIELFVINLIINNAILFTNSL